MTTISLQNLCVLNQLSDFSAVIAEYSDYIDCADIASKIADAAQDEEIASDNMLLGGWSTPAMLDRYLQKRKEDIKRAVAKLDEHRKQENSQKIHKRYRCGCKQKDKR